MSDQFGITLDKLQEGLGVSTISMAGQKLIDDSDIAKIREAGISRVEMCGLHGVCHFNHRDPEYVSEIKDALKRHDVTMPSMHAPCHDFANSDEAERKAAVEDTILAGRVAAELGAGVLVGHYGLDDLSRKGINQVLDGLEDVGIILTIENLPDVPDLKDYIEFIEDVDRDNFKLTVDIGHPRNPDGSFPFANGAHARKTLAQCGEHVVHLHLHDVKLGDDKTWKDHFPPFTGTVLWDEIFMALDDIGYSGEYMFEAASSTAWTWSDWPPLDEVLKATASFPSEFFSRYPPS